MDSELAIVGQNSAGKSSILRALNAFFNFEEERAPIENGSHDFAKNATVVIDISFTATPTGCTLPRINNGSDEVRVQLRYKKTPVWQIFVQGKWQSAPSDLHDELRKHIRYVYVPLRRDHEISSWGADGLLQSAVEAWLRAHTSRRDTISPKVSELGRSIRKNALSGLSKQLRKVTPMNGSFTFDLEYVRPPDYSLLLRDLTLRVREGLTIVDLADSGSGTQSMTAFALYSYLAELEGSTYVLGFEEPEQNLHPQAQRELLKNLRELPLQVIFTTHSTVMIDELTHDEVVLCRREKSATRGIETTTTQFDNSFWSRTGLNRSQYYEFYRRRNSEFFFANFVILTESPIDGEIVRELLRQAKVDLSTYSVSILSVDGVKSLPYAYHLLRTLNIEFATVVDKDYFMPYIHDELEKSRDARGFPRYKKEFRNGTLLETMIPEQTERDLLLRLLHENHSRAMDILEKSNVFCFKWFIEADLVNGSAALDELYKNMQIQPQDQTVRYLLVDRRKQLKKMETLLPVIRLLPPSNLPNSYKRLRKSLPALIKSTS
jgi:energy-coupling factor transporter ATP-binding protein EcfA2